MALRALTAVSAGADNAVQAKGNIKILTSCPSCLQGLTRYGNDLNNGLLEADYIVVEMANQILGKDWLPDYVKTANAGGIERESAEQGAVRHHAGFTREDGVKLDGFAIGSRAHDPHLARQQKWQRPARVAARKQDFTAWHAAHCGRSGNVFEYFRRQRAQGRKRGTQARCNTEIGVGWHVAVIMASITPRSAPTKGFRLFQKRVNDVARFLTESVRTTLNKSLTCGLPLEGLNRFSVLQKSLWLHTGLFSVSLAPAHPMCPCVHMRA